ncbi:hypothetical protein [uncultured Succinivibrio sp.]|uniref:hypothetical protein n=1 Tax=uncultured Succinivibrio sp. TaxID=540749 RepID=UPI0025CD5D5B|nr:hypothetical protein [uncultured Succinivibrio sp.]
MAIISSVITALDESAKKVAAVAKANRIEAIVESSKVINEALNNIETKEEYEIFIKLMEGKDVFNGYVPNRILALKSEYSIKEIDK